MPTIDISQPYPDIDRYWKLVERTLADVFQVNPRLADVLRKQISQRPAEEQLQFYHGEPLDVAADLAQKQPDPQQLAAYRNLADQVNWKL